ncbi:hypothetical protein [uncultured Bacteroides sp.]|uniref:hypothetical protein n=1 Tax=uncultured Bacteroides sp. TaxID=162156 RepID=UPI002AA8B9F7|nr:hypothetical protein [uncultured Bacteroides sp.]
MKNDNYFYHYARVMGSIKRMILIAKCCFYSREMHKRMHTYDQKTLTKNTNACKVAIAKWLIIKENRYADAMQREERRREENISCCFTTTSADASASSEKSSDFYFAASCTVQQSKEHGAVWHTAPCYLVERTVLSQKAEGGKLAQRICRYMLFRRLLF